ncbi:MAG: type II toxin-antitoxin system YafQ family toxin [Spirochaetales bacterium]|nr:type II toxin-antitoxin system YafQ family toxin [Spirochaetales bacterium]
MVEPVHKYKVQWTNQYKKDIKLAKKRNYRMEDLYEVIEKLANDELLEDRYRDHALEGCWVGHRELHIRSDWLLIYQKKENILILELSRTGTHSDLF